MRVVLLSAEYPPLEGGLGDYTRRLALALQQEGLEVAILTSAGAGGLPGDPLDVYPLVRRWGWGSLWTVARFLRVHRRDILHMQYQTGAYRMHPAIHFLPTVLRLLQSPPRLVVTMHDLRLPYLLPKAGLLRQRLVAGMLARAAAVVVTNGADGRRLGGQDQPLLSPPHFVGRGGGIGGWGEASDRNLLRPLRPGSLRRPPALIPLASSLPSTPPEYDRAQERARLGAAPGECLLGYFGLLHPSKGADLLLEALTGLRRAGRPARLLIVGGGSGATDPGNIAFGQALRGQIANLGLEEAVRWTGPCPEVEAAGSLRACDLVVLPYRDGASFRRSSLVAALVLGCAVVTTAAADPAEVSLGPGRPMLADGDNVALVPPGDAAALAEAIAALLDDPQRRQHLATGARQLGEAFRWEEVGRMTRALYEGLEPLPSP